MRNWGDESSTDSHESFYFQEIALAIPAMGSVSIIRPGGIDATDTAHREKNIDTTGSEESDPITHTNSFNDVDTKKLLRKLDLHLIPFLALIYLLCFLDRTNVGNARLAGLETDLKMKGLDYNIALAILFPFYVLAEIPSNMMLKRFRPSIWFTVIMVSWGLVMTCTGLIHNFQGLLACRAFLGLAEGGLFPGITYLITMWYRRSECGFRIALFFSAATAAGAFGGLLARGISEMAGVGGKPAWAWIFILEGLLTMVVGAFSYWAVNDYPSTTEVERRLSADSGLSEEFNLKYVGHAMKDWKIWVNMVITIGIFTPLYSFALFLPTILKNLGYTNNKAQLMTVPPYVVACIFTILSNYAADKAGQRGIFLLGFQSLAIIGFLMLVTNGIPHVQYAGTFLAASGIYSLVPLITAWTSNNIGGSMKRGVGIAMQVGFGNLGGAISGFVYLSKDGPRFVKGHCILIGLTSMSFILTSIMTLYYRRENARRDAILAEGNYSDEQKLAEREKGDDAMFYRYTV
ncbi:high-affinity nicotinic acid transporter [Drepanopeziza brunnea f. sp. 'multigermtubi' MB_m1]|uniref:High-affinity nicotinic acid transporter n=1 Tax=Marssonina brunnea f. sp. multigermtubi (strain MB_m1) TaxID=1072389 RepID=K1WQV9_MARBU|nr:high-affinity nicotinic acid transporter [Drepanopeziza brunnea f. sp. 'multigermtubi' MB_m1]EKD15411.1 high-affinity nicotinic acid transporter [Drepanopeziza brunnea f. sp. 'multigermtubi' MB_m1]